MNANRIFFLSHTLHTRTHHGSLPGEIANSQKLANLMRENGYPVEEILDIYENFPQKEVLSSLAFLNCALAEEGYEICDEFALPETKNFCQKIYAKKPSFLFLLTWNTNLGAVFATGIQRHIPTCSKLYVAHPNQVVMAPLYHPSSLLLTEALLANERAQMSGIPPWKMIHLPNQYPDFFNTLIPSRDYIEKKRKVSKNTCIIGSISRLEYQKNIEFALKAVKTLYEEGEDILYVLKGDYEEETSYPIYREWLKNLISEIEGEPWFLWHREPIPFAQMPQLYASFDIFLHLSGSEAGSNVIIEAIGAGVPSLILNGSVNPSMFKNAALFVETDGTAPQDIVRPFQVPSEKDLLQKLRALVQDKKLREEWGRKGREAAIRRFSQERTLERLPLIFKAMNAYHHKSRESEQIKKEVEALYQEDVKRYAS